MSTDLGPLSAPRVNACEPSREQVITALAVVRSAIVTRQDLVYQAGTHTIAGVRWFIGHLRGQSDGPGEEGPTRCGGGLMGLY